MPMTVEGAPPGLWRILGCQIGKYTRIEKNFAAKTKKSDM